MRTKIKSVQFNINNIKEVHIIIPYIKTINHDAPGILYVLCYIILITDVFSALAGLAWDSNIQDSTFHCHISMYNI